MTSRKLIALSAGLIALAGVAPALAQSRTPPSETSATGTAPEALENHTGSGAMTKSSGSAVPPAGTTASENKPTATGGQPGGAAGKQ